MDIPQILFLEANRVWRTYPGGKTLPLSEGMKFLVPYQTGPVSFESEEGMEVIATFPPQ
ncbi:MAG: hypothetical protein ACKVGW_09725 [Verrucomicrobiia bacterium]